ncbi:MAG TPA: PA14 domain-containing protein [Dongiaceae bacterium]|nr:PA14 domain-containing protein [Dongiaceae bacterium]
MIFLGLLATARGENVPAGGPLTGLPQLLALVAGTNGVAQPVSFAGEVLWVGAGHDQLVVQTAAGPLRVKMDLYGQPPLVPGQRIHIAGTGLAGQGFLNDAVVDNDGLHSATEKSGTMHLTAGRHPLRAEWFNGRSDSVFTLEYAGPELPRQPVPNQALFHRDTGNDAAPNSWQPGLGFRCFQGDWEWLPHWQEAIPVKTGVATNFDIGVRTRDQNVGLQFNGYLQVDREGDYTFWCKSDDGGRLYLGEHPLQIEVLGISPLPQPREVQPGQPLAANEDCFWAVASGVITGIHIDLGGTKELELSAPSGRMYVELDAAETPLPVRFSRVRVTGLCRSTRLAGQGRVAGRLLVSHSSQIEVLTAARGGIPAGITTLAELRRLAANGQRTGSRVQLTGTVVAIGSRPGLFAFQDATGGILVRMDGYSPGVVVGQQITLTGEAILDGNRLYLNCAPLVDNDGLHLKQEKTGARFLSAGRHAIHVFWFNRTSPSALEVYYQGPDLPRQRIPDAALTHAEINQADGSLRWVPGLNYRCYEGDWQGVPKISRLDPAELGNVANFDVRAATRAEKVGVEFGGYLEVPRDGEYYFSVQSDDGSLLYLDEAPPQLTGTGTNRVIAPQVMAPRQILAPDQNYRWAEVEGTVNFAYERGGSLFLELSSAYGLLSVELADGTGCSPLLLLGSRVRVDGFCQSAHMPGGQEVAATLVTPGMEQIQLLEIAPGQWNRYPVRPIREVLHQLVAVTDEEIVHVRGQAGIGPDGWRLVVRDETGDINVEMAQPLPADLGATVEVIGRLIRSETNIVLRCGICREPPAPRAPDSGKLPLLTTVQQVKQLTREQAQRGYPVKIRGVITLVRGTGTGFIIQDDTSAIDVWWPPNASTSLPRVGDYWEVAGETFADFSPNIRSRHAVRLGAGTLPEPLRPAYDQLLNGSLDTRYVEVQGILTAIEPDGVTLLVRGGKIGLLLSAVPPDSLQRYAGALVRIRGCVVPLRDEKSHQVEVGRLRLSNVSLSVDEPAPLDPFALPAKRAAELLLFDARAGSFQRVKIAGQILHAADREFYLQDGTNAVRVLTAGPAAVTAGDLVEAVGFPELGGALPVLREALLRQTGTAALPAPVPRSGEALFSKKNDGQLIAVTARLVGMSGSQSEKFLELQTDGREFGARLEVRNGLLPELKPGSLLEVAGVYAEPGGNSGAAALAGSFELLLNAPDAVKVLERPPWWTLQRALMFAGGLAVVVLAGLFWIVLLRRRVEERTAELAREIQQREHIQQQNALERERSRIAKDMHDQLGTSVTQVSLLAELTKNHAADPGKTVGHAARIGQTAFELGRTLDEIVWAVNPKNDSLDKFCDYMAVQAQELFQLAPVLCRVDLPPEMPKYPLTAEVRHNLFLATKEALNNVIRHANAREVWIRFQLTAGQFQISIVDDGQGFDLQTPRPERNGLQNMRKRLEDAGGRFAIASRPGGGTKVTLILELPPGGMPESGKGGAAPA